MVALGGTALAALAGKALPVGANRGPFDFDGRPGFVTVHPSYLLRIPDAAARARPMRSSSTTCGTSAELAA